MTKIQDLQQAINTKNKIGDRIIKLEDDLCRERHSDTVCDFAKGSRYEKDAKDSMELKRKEILEKQ